MIWLTLIGVLIFIFLLLILLLIFTRVTIEIFFTYADHRKDLFIYVRLLRFIKIKRTIPLIKLNTDTLTVDIVQKDQFMNSKKEKKKSYNYDDIQQHWQRIKSVIDTTKDVIPHLMNAFHSIKLIQLNWHSLIGLKSANDTAIFTGALYSIKGTISTFLTCVLKNETTPQYSIQPNYSKLTYQTELKCILSFQIGQIMRELFSIIRKYEKLKKVGN